MSSVDSNEGISAKLVGFGQYLKLMRVPEGFKIDVKWNIETENRIKIAENTKTYVHHQVNAVKLFPPCTHQLVYGENRAV